MSYTNLLVADDGAIRVITINRPDQLNALNRDTINELDGALTEAEADKNVRVIIITGSGIKAFVAGADIKEFAHFSVEEGKALSADGHKKLFTHVERLNKPVIAAVNGFALGGGLELAMSCHFRVASETAKLGLPEVGLGVIPGYGGTQRLAQLVGKGKAMEMILLGSTGMIPATEALQWGLVNHVVPAEQLLSTTLELAGKIARNSPTALGAAIRAVNAGYEPGTNGMQREIEEFGKCFGTADFKEGTMAFMEKRKANFTGS
ncbi:MAG: enoyl-CoA hydratase/isomerase family protein [Flavobacteriales bacterium]|jgi:enoyl-CoA hydratase|nr:enoyl-CoA hydratase/isomerase family protein [Flavobacteriales bacterium]MBK6881425.1 enoyl-CoA hydratase/isomerase family protein [Flavobacteriales bacterium]MBK7102742.1 enoyl-CoA hydratase/isomerase family protein [Flavobacteriales bacterium]MBK7113652.1 enoyl-CoA hydratase/isomerase family protein [Flavobacteriales bacterium]MBK8531014.1 enoyl-CoA hydratase/isomerase family protein [Flavobacteriales bacterium]